MGKIIVIESDEILRKYITDKLRNLSFEVIACKDGFEGIVKVKNEIPDLIIMDLVLDRMDAFQILKEKLDYKTTTQIPVLVISPTNDPETTQKLHRFKVNKIVPKPLKIDLLLQYISDIFKVKFEIDRTDSVVDVHLNDDVLFIEISGGLNIDKIEILKYRIIQIKGFYKKLMTKVLIMLTNIDAAQTTVAKLDYLFDIVTEETDAGRSGIKILSFSDSVAAALVMSKYMDIEVYTDFAKAIDALGKIDAFAYGDEIDDIKAQLLESVEHEVHRDAPIELAFSSEKRPIKDRYSIAIIDDDLYVLEYMATVLDRENWVINTYENPKTFLRELTDNRPDLIFLDLMMPEMNGFQFAKYLIEKNVYIPIVIVTALSQKEMVLKAREFGITNFMTKPIKADTLISKAEEMLKMSI